MDIVTYGSSLVNGAAKTKNVYSEGSSDDREHNYIANSGKYGDALYETSANGNSGSGSWYGIYSDFPDTRDPFFLRGGVYSNGAGAGVFWFSGDNGYDDRYSSFRPVLVVL